MSVSDGQPVNASVTNAAYMSRTQNTDTAGKVDLLNADVASGSNITNAQRSLNGQASFSGASANGAKDQKPAWTDNSVGSPTDDLKDRADALTTAVSAVADQVGVQLPQWQKVTIGFADIQTAALTNTAIALALPPAGVIEKIVIKHTQEFTGGSVSALSVDLGISGESNRYFDNFDIFAAPSGTSFEVLSLTEIFDFDNAQNIEALFTAVGDNLDQLTQGSLDIYFLTSTLGF